MSHKTNIIRCLLLTIARYVCKAMKKAGTIIYSIIAILFVFTEALVLMFIAFIIFVIAYPFDRKRKVLHVYSGWWGLHYFYINPFWKVRYSGKENVDKHKTYIIISNHQSYFDICAMYKLPLVFKWVSKAEATKIPFIGWLLPIHGDVLITRGESRSAKAMINKCAKWIERGASISIFPEGTRTPDGQIKKFKEGAFLLAKMNKLPILPVVMDGTIDMLPKKGFGVGGRATIQIKVLPEISSEVVERMTIKELTVYLHDLMLEEHKRIAPQRYIG